MDKESAYKKWFDNKLVVIFDLDGTMYREWDYLSAAYLEIGKDVENKFGVSSSQVYQFLADGFAGQGRHSLFDKLIGAFSLPPGYMPEALSILRRAEMPGKLIIYQEIRACLEWLIDRDRRIFIVTNGNSMQQKNKIRNIEFGDLLNHIHIIYADEIKPKPDPAVYFHLQGIFKTRKEETVMVGDSGTDEAFAAAAGIDFIPVNHILNLT